MSRKHSFPDHNQKTEPTTFPHLAIRELTNSQDNQGLRKFGKELENLLNTQPFFLDEAGKKMGQSIFTYSAVHLDKHS